MSETETKTATCSEGPTFTVWRIAYENYEGTHLYDGIRGDTRNALEAIIYFSEEEAMKARSHAERSYRFNVRAEPFSVRGGRDKSQRAVLNRVADSPRARTHGQTIADACITPMAVSGQFVMCGKVFYVSENTATVMRDKLVSAIDQYLAGWVAQTAKQDDALRKELEQARVQLAGCLTAAEGCTSSPAKQGDYGWSPAYQRVLELYSFYRHAWEELTIAKERLQKKAIEAHPMDCGLTKKA